MTAKKRGPGKGQAGNSRMSSEHSARRPFRRERNGETAGFHQGERQGWRESTHDQGRSGRNTAPWTVRKIDQ